MKHLEQIANIAVIVAVVVFLGLVVRGDVGWHKAAQAPPPIPSQQDLAGTTVRLPGLQFPTNQSTLLLVVSANCHFCKESMPFYKQLTEEARGRLNVIAVMPEPKPEAQKFLLDAGVETNQIVSATPDTLGVRGTPTVLLVEGSGKVKRA